MHEILEAIILGIIQGLTEFLPVSSSGHLEIAKYILNDDSLAKESLATSVLLHLATALATIVVFHKEILEIVMGVFSKSWNNHKTFSLYILVSMIPAGLAGYYMADILEQLFNKKIFFVACMLLITGLLLYFSERIKRKEKDLTLGSAFIIGISQAIALLPGISRSGATISTALILGIEKEKAARFSFLMVVPLIIGKVIKDVVDEGALTHIESPSYMLAGFIASFISGWLACNWMLAIVKRSKLIYFAAYCIIVAFAIIIVYLIVFK